MGRWERIRGREVHRKKRAGDFSAVKSSAAAVLLFFLLLMNDAGCVFAASATAFSPQIDRYVEGEIQRFLAGTGVFDTVEASAHIAVEASLVKEMEHRYEAAENAEQGVKAGEKTYREEAGESAVTESWTDYLPGGTFTQIVTPSGILPEESSIAVTAVMREVYEEDALRESGELDGAGFARFQKEHGEERAPETEKEYAELLARGTGIPEENITVIVHRMPVFVPSKEGERELPVPVFMAGAGILGLAVLVLAIRIAKGKKRRKQGAKKAKATDRNGENAGAGKTGGRGKPRAIPDGEGMSEAERYIRRYIDQNPGEASGKFREWKDKP